MLIDTDSKPNDTIFYIAIQLNNILREIKAIKITDLDSTFNNISPNRPAFKYYLALNFLYLLNKVEVKEDEVSYVSS